MYNKNRKEQVKSLWDEGFGVMEISRKLGIKDCNVSTLLTKILGPGNKGRFIYKRRVFTLNESFFEEIDTESRAYFLGLLAADGNLSSAQNSVRIGLNEKDKDILECFRKELNYTKPLYYIKKVKEEGWNRSNQYQLEVSSSIFRKSLEKWGLTPNKSLTLEFPNNFPQRFLGHYLRGYFDGDGCIHVGKKNKAEISIAGSKSFCDSLSTIMKTYNISLRSRLSSKGNCYYGRIAGGKNIEKFYNLLYKDSTIFLERKKRIFDNWLEIRMAPSNLWILND